jgi:hypothetical protein
MILVFIKSEILFSAFLFPMGAYAKIHKRVRNKVRNSSLYMSAVESSRNSSVVDGGEASQDALTHEPAIKVNVKKVKKGIHIRSRRS